MPRYSFVLTAIVGLVGVPAQSQVVAPPESASPATPPTVPERTGDIGPTEARFRAYVAAMEAHDLALRNLRWRETVTISNAGSKPQKLWDGEMAVDTKGRWFCIGLQYFIVEGTENKQRVRLLWDGERVFAQNEVAQRGIIRGHETELINSMLSPMMLIGRSLDWTAPGVNQRRLADLLREATDVEVNDAAAPIVVVSGSVKFGTKWMRLDVSIDASKDFMPVKIVRVDELSGMKKEELEVTESQRVGGVWLPIRGTRSLFSLEPADETVSTRLGHPKVQERAKALNLDRRTDRLQLVEIQRSAFGGPPFRAKVLGGGTHICAVSEMSVLEDADVLMTPAKVFAVGAKVFDVAKQQHLIWTENGFVVDPNPPPSAESPPGRLGGGGNPATASPAVK